VAEIGLAEVVRALRAELEIATSEGEGQEIRFEATAVDLEFNVGVKKSKEGKAGIRFWVVELGGGGAYASESIQTVKLSLQPSTASGGRVRITRGTDESPLSQGSE
jgi:Trypsin-co-occurring domain 2